MLRLQWLNLWPTMCLGMVGSHNRANRSPAVEQLRQGRRFAQSLRPFFVVATSTVVEGGVQNAELTWRRARRAQDILNAVRRTATNDFHEVAELLCGLFNSLTYGRRGACGKGRIAAIGGRDLTGTHS